MDCTIYIINSSSYSKKKSVKVGDLGLCNSSGSLFLEKIDCPSLSSHKLPGTLYLGTEPCEISSIHVGMPTGIAIV